MPVIIETKECAACKGAGHTVVDDGEKDLCRKCDGIGEVCKCCGRPLYGCRHNDNGEELC